MPVNDRAALIDEFSAAWGAKDLDALMELMAPDCEFGASLGPGPGTRFVGRDEVRRGYGLFLAPSDGPEPEAHNAAPLIDEDFAVTRWSLRWPQQDGSAVEVRGCDVFEFEGDRIRSKDTYRKAQGELPSG